MSCIYLPLSEYTLAKVYQLQVINYPEKRISLTCSAFFGWTIISWPVTYNNYSTWVFFPVAQDYWERHLLPQLKHIVVEVPAELKESIRHYKKWRTYSKKVVNSRRIINLLIFGWHQTMQINGNIEGFPLYQYPTITHLSLFSDLSPTLSCPANILYVIYCIGSDL